MNKYTLNTASALRLLSRLYESVCRAYPELKFVIDTGIREMSIQADDGTLVKFERDFFNDDVWEVTTGNKSIIPTMHHLVMHDHVPFHLPPQPPVRQETSSFRFKIPGLGIDIQL